jgi:hypothetical protein
LWTVTSFQQFEVWQMSKDRWEQVASFVDFDVAYGLTKNRTSQVRLLKVTYEGDGTAQQEVIAEVGATRSEP